jgi:hypothetical protein
METLTNPYIYSPYERTSILLLWAPSKDWVQKIDPVDLEIDEVTKRLAIDGNVAS